MDTALILDRITHATGDCHHLFRLEQDGVLWPLTIVYLNRVYRSNVLVANGSGNSMTRVPEIECDDHSRRYQQIRRSKGEVFHHHRVAWRNLRIITKHAHR